MKYYKSQQVRQVMGPNGIQETIMDVEVKNGKGTKSVTVMEDGKTRKSIKKLSKKEIKNIGMNRFMPGFFTKCIGDCNKAKTRSKAKARKTMKKKRV
jgi:hypothetical protein